ncbi:hypothetical protein Q9R46_24045 [Paenibacillus sp. RRE4]|nr:hypothetical protein [Paenibacillus sp. RRE4]MDT0125753.1 hypothetical protein [Paenibacillus sp. RRE4]
MKRQKADFGVQDNPAGRDRYSHERGDCSFILPMTGDEPFQ